MPSLDPQLCTELWSAVDRVAAVETLQERFQGPDGEKAGRMVVFRLLFGAFTQERGLWVPIPFPGLLCVSLGG